MKEVTIQITWFLNGHVIKAQHSIVPYAQVGNLALVTPRLTLIPTDTLTVEIKQL